MDVVYSNKGEGWKWRVYDKGEEITHFNTQKEAVEYLLKRCEEYEENKKESDK